MSEFVSELTLDVASDVYALRQSGRLAAAAVGCDEAAQVRFATALSELGREAVAHGGNASARFSIDADGMVVIDIDRFPRAALNGGATGLDAARKLLGEIGVLDGDSASVVTLQLRPVSGPAVTATSSTALRALLARAVPPGPLDQLRLENRDLIEALENLTSKQDQLVQLNDELEETNRGVMAMHAQLADELEETNRGVVALYAELDDKTVRLKEASDAKSRFLANANHELRGPVNSVIGLARLLLDPEGAPLTADQRNELTLIYQSAQELLKLVNLLLDLAKAESGRLQPDITRVDIAEIFSELRGALRPLLRSGVTLQVDMPLMPPIETDRTLLTQVIRNLLTNAVRFTTHGAVILSARLIAAYQVGIAVTDTGIGIAPDDQVRIFEEFYQVRGPLQADGNGTGLGLPYARRVTESLGGRLRLKSEPGLGSTFTIEIPTGWEPLVSASVSPGRETTSVQVASVLIVDDDAAFRVVLRGMLQGTAGDILEASGGVESLQLMRVAIPDVAFVDLRMPDMDGRELLATMGADPMLRDIPVVLVTSAELTPSIRATLRPGTGLLAKSNVNRASVQLALTEALNSQPASP